MPVDNVPSQTERAFREKFLNSDRRLKELERRFTGLGAEQAVVPGGDRFPGYSFPNATVGDLAPLWKATRDIAYVQAIINCVSAGGSTGSFVLELNGTPVLTLSLLSGETTHTYAALFSVAKDSFLGGELTAVAGQIIPSVQLVEAE